MTMWPASTAVIGTDTERWSCDIFLWFAALKELQACDRNQRHIADFLESGVQEISCPPGPGLACEFGKARRQRSKGRTPCRRQAAALLSHYQVRETR